MLEMSWGGEINVIKHAIFAGLLVNISFCVHIPQIMRKINFYFEENLNFCQNIHLNC